MRCQKESKRFHHVSASVVYGVVMSFTFDRAVGCIVYSKTEEALWWLLATTYNHPSGDRLRGDHGITEVPLDAKAEAVEARQVVRDKLLACWSLASCRLLFKIALPRAAASPSIEQRLMQQTGAGLSFGVLPVCIFHVPSYNCSVTAKRVEMTGGIQCPQD